MEVLDRGHDYLLASLDGREPIRLTFVKRNDPPDKYPGNDSAYGGTQIQEVLRALIERCHYLEGQVPCMQTEAVLVAFERSLWILEQRHTERHGDPDAMDIYPIKDIDLRGVCQGCGHIECYCEETL